MILALVISLFLVQQPPVPRELPIEVFEVSELPITVIDTILVETKHGYLLKGVLTNSSEFRQLGLRYSLAVVDSTNVTSTVITRSEGLRLAPYQTRSVTFKTPIRLKLKGDERFVLMLEDAISTDYVWQVLKAKQSLAAYIAHDYSTKPTVLRVLNQVDAPLRPGPIY
jgi:hypothetical protein